MRNEYHPTVGADHRSARFSVGLSRRALQSLVPCVLIAALCAAALSGCTNSQTWRADGIGVSCSAAAVSIIYGEIDRIPPGGYYSRTRTIDLRPVWQQWFTSPPSNCLATSTLIIDARRVLPNSYTNTITYTSGSCTKSKCACAESASP